MDEDKQVGSEEHDRADSDRERSQEAHWEVAEAGAEDAEEERRQTPKKPTAAGTVRTPSNDDETAKKPK